MKLNEVRHFYFLKDKKKFSEKKTWLFGEEILKTLELDLILLKTITGVPIFNIGQHKPLK